MEMQNDDFFHYMQVVNQVDYTEAQIDSLKKIFSSNADDEKLRIMKLEQDAQAKQQSMATLARKRVKPDNGVRIINDKGEQRTSMVDWQ